MSYRHARWFWTGQEKKLFTVSFDEGISDEVKKALLEQPDELEDSTDEESSEKSEEELSDLECDIEEQSIHSVESSDIQSMSDKSSSDDSDEGSDDDEELDIFAEVNQFPVMMIFTETSEGTMDDLLDDYEKLGCEPGSDL